MRLVPPSYPPCTTDGLMRQMTVCPEDQQLREIVAGRSAADDEAFAAHLEQCPACSRRLDRLLAGDTLLEAMQAQTIATDLSSNPAVPPLVQRLLKMQPAAETFAFLAPPHTEGEIGRVGS